MSEIDPKEFGEVRANTAALLRLYEEHTREEREYRAEDRAVLRDQAKAFDARVAKLADDLRDALAGHDTRLGAVERWQARILGAIALLSAGLVAASGLLPGLLKFVWVWTRGGGA